MLEVEVRVGESLVRMLVIRDVEDGTWAMKYMIMTFGSQDTMMKTKSTEWIKEMIDFMTVIDSDLRASGELVDDQGLVDPHQAKTVVFRDGAPVAIDGPFVDPDQSLAGWWVVDVPDERRATEIASRIVAFIEAPLEVRRIAEGPPEV